MTTTHEPLEQRRSKRQGSLQAFGITGALALALTACGDKGDSGSVMIAPPNDFKPQQAAVFSNTNSPPTAPYVYSSGGNGSYLGGHGYFHLYGYPNYYYRPAPGTSVELVEGGSSTYAAGSPDEARQSVSRGGFGESGGEGGGHSSGVAHGGGEGGGHGGGE